MTLHLRRRTGPWGPYTEVVTDRRCPCGRPLTIAHTVMETVAATLAEPLRRAFDSHLDQHGCAERGGFGQCEEAMRLFRLLPEADRVLIA